MSDPKPKKPVQYDIVGKRADSMGLFWTEPKVIKPPPAEKIKRVPPEPTWLADDFLPNLTEAQNWNPDLYTAQELWAACALGEKHVFDIENYPNYFLIMFKSLETGKICYFEKTQEHDLAIPTLKRVIESLCIIGFNSKNYDIPMLALALAGKSFEELQLAQSMIIEQREQPYMVLRQFKVKNLDVNHIDLIEVAPLAGSLKEYGGRMHTQHMQDLPFDPHKPLDVCREEKIAILRYYCENDLTNTEDLYKDLKKSIDIREDLGQQYGLDLRSKSDAQIAEAVISSEMVKLTGVKPKRQEIMPGTAYYYQAPLYLNYKSEMMQWVMSTIAQVPFVVSEYGRINLPDQMKDLKVLINETEYQIGIGGLHSCESNKAHFACKEYLLKERDVASYYPMIILNLMLCPENLGANFLRIYQTIVTQRLEAKANAAKATTDKDRRHWKRIADLLKITINGTFGKLGNKWSIMFSPRLLLQVTITGQLSLLYLIEKLELAGIQVVSANTDGIVIKCLRSREAECDAIIAAWEKETNFETDETPYNALLSRSVNDYLAVKVKGGVKGKGGLGWGLTRLHKNPVNGVCIKALEEFLQHGTSIEETVRSCTDVRQFLTVRKVTGGAVRDGVYLGKAIRWYYAKDAPGEIVYAKSGNKVPKSDGALGLMQLPDQLPENVDFDRYIVEAYEMLAETGYPVQ